MATRQVITQTVIISLVFFLTLFIVSRGNLLSSQLGFKLEPVHVFIALIPFIILLIVSGKLKEIRGPGGIGLSMRDEIQKPVSSEIIESTSLEVDSAYVMQKGSSIRDKRNEIAENPPQVLSFKIGVENIYANRVISEYIDVLEPFPEFRFILFNDKNGKFMGCMKFSDFKVVLRTGDILQMIESGQILNTPRVIRNSIQTTSTTRQALNEMERLKSNILPVVDHEQKFIGMVTQEELVRKILIKVLREA